MNEIPSKAYSPLFQNVVEQPKLQHLKVVSGKVPLDLRGELYRIGIGQFEEFGQRLSHWFDGAGFITRIIFGDNTVQGQWKLLDVTPKMEKKSHNFQYGRFGRAPTSLWQRIRGMWDHKTYVNSANTSIFQWQQRLLALYEGAHPTEVDRHSLEILQETDLGVVRRAFSAHPKRLASRKTTFNFGFRIHPRPCLDIYSLPDHGKPTLLASIPYNGATFVHDFAVTQDYVVFVVSPVFASPWNLILKGQSLAESLKFEPSKDTQILVVPIENTDNWFQIKTAPFFFTHTANAFMPEDGMLCVDGVHYPDGSNLDWINSVSPSNPLGRPFRPGQLQRLEIDVQKKVLNRKIPLADENIEVPQINPHNTGRPYRYVYAAGYSETLPTQSGFYDCLYKIDVEEKKVQHLSVGENQIVNEPLFVPKKEAEREDSGYLLCLHFDIEEQMTYCSVFDMESDSLSVIAKISLGQAIPFTVHGTWISAPAG